jgi:hypothetical protein
MTMSDPASSPSFSSSPSSLPLSPPTSPECLSTLHLQSTPSKQDKQEMTIEIHKSNSNVDNVKDNIPYQETSKSIQTSNTKLSNSSDTGKQLSSRLGNTLSSLEKLPTTKGIPRIRCGECEACLREDCGECSRCRRKVRTCFLLILFVLNQSTKPYTYNLHKQTPTNFLVFVIFFLFTRKNLVVMVKSRIHVFIVDVHF